MLTNDVSSNDCAVSGTQRYVQRARELSKRAVLSSIAIGLCLSIGWMGVECIKKGGSVTFQWKDFITLIFKAYSQDK